MLRANQSKVAFCIGKKESGVYGARTRNLRRDRAAL
jgi:hypothetical protein